jgi:hypothetical protein
MEALFHDSLIVIQFFPKENYVSNVFIINPAYKIVKDSTKILEICTIPAPDLVLIPLNNSSGVQKYST